MLSVSTHHPNYSWVLMLSVSIHHPNFHSADEKTNVEIAVNRAHSERLAWDVLSLLGEWCWVGKCRLWELGAGWEGTLCALTANVFGW